MAASVGHGFYRSPGALHGEYCTAPMQRKHCTASMALDIWSVVHCSALQEPFSVSASMLCSLSTGESGRSNLKVHCTVLGKCRRVPTDGR